MNYIKIICVGNIKKKYFVDASNEYLKRLSIFSKIEIEEIKSESFGKSDKQRVKNIEGEKIQTKLEKHDKNNIFLLDERGKEFTSIKFSEFIDNNQQIIFVIGGTLGFSENILKQYQSITLSQMTLPHEMVRVILYEQIYRAYTIIKGKEYHY